MASLPNFNALLMEGFNTGREIRRQEGERNALAGLFGAGAKAPGQTPGIGDGVGAYEREQEALGELARYNPQMAFQIRGQSEQRQAQLQKVQQEKLEQAKKVVGQSALQIAQLPEADRPNAWDQQIDYLVSQGYDGLAQYRGKYNPQSLMGVIAEAGLANELRTATQPNYQVIPEGGTLVNTRDARAVSQFGAPQADMQARPASPSDGAQMGNAQSARDMTRVLQSQGPQRFLKWQQQFGVPVLVTSPEEAAAFPPGTLLVTPDGRTGSKK